MFVVVWEFGPDLLPDSRGQPRLAAYPIHLALSTHEMNMLAPQGSGFATIRIRPGSTCIGCIGFLDIGVKAE